MVVQIVSRSVCVGVRSRPCVTFWITVEAVDSCSSRPSWGQGRGKCVACAKLIYENCSRNYWQSRVGQRPGRGGRVCGRISDRLTHCQQAGLAHWQTDGVGEWRRDGLSDAIEADAAAAVAIMSQKTYWNSLAPWSVQMFEWPSESGERGMLESAQQVLFMADCLNFKALQRKTVGKQGKPQIINTHTHWANKAWQINFGGCQLSGIARKIRKKSNSKYNSAGFLFARCL